MAFDSAIPWRPAYEMYACLGWLIVAATTGMALAEHPVPRAPLTVALVVSLFLAIVRASQAVGVWLNRWALQGRDIEWMSTDQVHLKALAKPGHVWLGWGFVWSRTHAQRWYELKKLDLERLRVPLASLWNRLRPRGLPNKGNPTLHGLNAAERDIYVPLTDLYGHVFITAATGALKTSVLALLAVQAIRRTPREAVVIVEPKGGSQLRDLLRAECEAVGREFAVFHPASPQESVRLDTLASWSRTTEVPSRIAALIPSETGHDPWSAFGWRVLHVVTEGCVATYGARPTLATLRRYVEGGVEPLLQRTLIKYFEERGTDWRVAIEPHLRAVSRNARPGTAASAETLALVALYKQQSSNPNSLSAVDGLVSMFEHNREHAQKMLASLIPILTMLTAGELAGLLSPDRSDAADSRPILTAASIVESASVVYMGLDALSDAVVAFAIASIVMADLTAHAGTRFQLGLDQPRINIFVDEANEAVNIPFIQMLNKSRSAGYTVVFCSQTFPDFVAKLGSEARARQVLGNANSIVAGRTKDAVTAEYVLENFGETIITNIQRQQSTHTVVGGRPLSFSVAYGERQNETAGELVPREALGELPDLEYFASFSGRALLKGRIPLLHAAPLPASNSAA